MSADDLSEVKEIRLAEQKPIDFLIGGVTNATVIPSQQPKSIEGDE